MLRNMVSSMNYRRICTGLVSLCFSWWGSRLTLAKKFDAVHRNTVTRSRNIPSVRRATFASPILALNPPDLNVACDLKEDIESLSNCSSDLRSVAENWPATAGGINGSCALIFRLCLLSLYPLSICVKVGNEWGTAR